MKHSIFLLLHLKVKTKPFQKCTHVCIHKPITVMKKYFYKTQNRGKWGFYPLNSSFLDPWIWFEKKTHGNVKRYKKPKLYRNIFRIHKKNLQVFSHQMKQKYHKDKTQKIYLSFVTKAFWQPLLQAVFVYLVYFRFVLRNIKVFSSNGIVSKQVCIKIYKKAIVLSDIKYDWRVCVFLDKYCKRKESTKANMKYFPLWMGILVRSEGEKKLHSFPTIKSW